MSVSGFFLLTNVVVAVLDHKCNALAIEVGLAGGFDQAVSSPPDVAQELAILEAAPRERVDDSSRHGLLLSDGLKDR